MRLAAATIAAAALALPAQQAQAQTWSGPDDLSSAHDFLDDLHAVAGRDGRLLAAWRFQDGVDEARRAGASAASRAPGAAAFGPARRLTRRSGIDRIPETIGGLEAYGRDRALLAVTRPATRGATPRIRLEVRFGRTDGTFGRRITIRRPGRSAAQASRIRDVSLAVSPRGHAALAWFEDRGVRTDRVYVALRRPGRAFGAPRRLATGRVRGVVAGIGASGDAVVAWDARGTVRARFKPRTRRSFRAAQEIRSQPAFNAELRAAVTPHGRAVLAWSAQRASEGGERGPVLFEAAAQPASAPRFRRAELLERLPTDAGLGRPIDAAVDATGTVAIAWSGSDGARRRVRASYAEQSGSFAPPQDLSAPGRDALLSDVAAGVAGGLIAVWDGGIEDPSSVVGAAVSPFAVQPYGPPEVVSSGETDARFGRAAFDRRGRPTVVFANRPAGSTGPADRLRTVARAATRSEPAVQPR